MSMQINGNYNTSQTDYAERVRKKQAAERAEKAKEAEKAAETKDAGRMPLFRSNGFVFSKVAQMLENGVSGTLFSGIFKMG